MRAPAPAPPPAGTVSVSANVQYSTVSTCTILHGTVRESRRHERALEQVWAAHRNVHSLLVGRGGVVVVVAVGQDGLVPFSAPRLGFGNLFQSGAHLRLKEERRDHADADDRQAQQHKAMLRAYSRRIGLSLVCVNLRAEAYAAVVHPASQQYRKRSTATHVPAVECSAKGFE